MTNEIIQISQIIPFNHPNQQPISETFIWRTAILEHFLKTMSGSLLARDDRKVFSSFNKAKMMIHAFESKRKISESAHQS
jgi:hypothetical protein